MSSPDWSHFTLDHKGFPSLDEDFLTSATDMNDFLMSHAQDPQHFLCDPVPIIHEDELPPSEGGVGHFGSSNFFSQHPAVKNEDLSLKESGSHQNSTIGNSRPFDFGGVDRGRSVLGGAGSFHPPSSGFGRLPSPRVGSKGVLSGTPEHGGGTGGLAGLSSLGSSGPSFTTPTGTTPSAAASPGFGLPSLHRDFSAASGMTPPLVSPLLGPGDSPMQHEDSSVVYRAPRSSSGSSPSSTPTKGASSSPVNSGPGRARLPIFKGGESGDSESEEAGRSGRSRAQEQVRARDESNMNGGRSQAESRGRSNTAPNPALLQTTSMSPRSLCQLEVLSRVAEQMSPRVDGSPLLGSCASKGLPSGSNVVDGDQSAQQQHSHPAICPKRQQSKSHEEWMEERGKAVGSSVPRRPVKKSAGVKRRYEDVVLEDEVLERIRQQSWPPKLLELEKKFAAGKLSPGELKEFQKQRKLVKNRESAAISRVRKSRFMEHLETQVDTLSEENEELHNHIETLEAEIRRLQAELNELKQIQGPGRG